jgi:hypothetical protein
MTSKGHRCALAALVLLALATGQDGGLAGGRSSTPDTLIDRTRNVIEARYRDVGAALRAGYQPVATDALVVHYVNDRYVADGHILDPDRPEALMYSNGRRPELLGAMFMMDRPGQPGPPIDGRRVWHHHTLCIGASGGNIAATGSCPRGDVRRDSPEMAHVWLAGLAADPLAADMQLPAMVCQLRPGSDGPSAQAS